MPRRPLLLLYGTLAVAALVLTHQRSLNAANPSADLDQCRNGDQLHPVQCTGAAWVNGNAGASNAHWFEGDSIAYRMRFSNLTAGPHVLVIEWDTTQGGKHALDYITSVDRTEANAEPCSGVSGCTGTFATGGIPADPNVVAAGISSSTIAGRWNQAFKLYNAGASGSINTIVSSDYVLNGVYAGNSSTRLTITFNTSAPNPVLAWGGHIAARQDWGTDNSAIAINGSPYHMRLIALDGSGGNQDRSLSSAAAIFPATLTIIKDVQTSTGGAATSGDEFVFTTTGPNLPSGGSEVPSPFSLWDDTSNPTPDTTPRTLTYNLTLFGNSNAVTITETAYTKYNQLLVCSEAAGGLPQNNNSTPSTITATRVANIIAEEGEIITCAYTNKIKTATLTVKKIVSNDNGGTKGSSDFTMHVKTSVNGQLTDVTNSPQAGSSSGTVYTLAAGTYVVSENDPTSLNYTQQSFAVNQDCDSSGNVTLAAGDSKTCIITNDDNPASLTIVKKIVNDNGGTKAVIDFGITTTAGTLSFGSGVADGANTLKYAADKLTGLSAGSYTLHESDVTGYTEGSWSCTGGTGLNSNFNTGSITLAIGDDVTCTITNNDEAQSNGSSTAQSAILHDSATISNIRPVTGTTYKVTFRLYKNVSEQTPTCTTPIFTATRDLTLTGIQGSNPPLSNGTASTTGAASTGTTDTGSNTVNQSAKYYWTVQMASDANNAGAAEECGKELTDLTINNNN